MKITAFLRVFSPDQKCDNCRRIYADQPLFKFFYENGTTKTIHGDCQKA